MHIEIAKHALATVSLLRRVKNAVWLRCATKEDILG
jgi:hypothetical protein